MAEISTAEISTAEISMAEISTSLGGRSGRELCLSSTAGGVELARGASERLGVQRGALCGLRCV